MPRVIICGVLCNNDIALAELLSRHQIPVTILRHISQTAPDQVSLPGTLKYFDYKNIQYFSSPLEFYSLCRKSDLVISINGYYPSMMNIKSRFLSKFFGIPPVINLTCGSDITEFILSTSSEAKKYLRHLESSLFNYISPYTHAARNITHKKLKNFTFLHANYYLLGKRQPHKSPENSPLMFLHPSNLDWAKTDDTPGRNSTKGNDRFLRAFIRALKAGVKAKCTILDRGPDRFEARKIVEESGFSDAFDWKDNQTPSQLKELILSHDAIIDQFDVGGFGGIALEAMAQGKPVMIHIDKNCWPLVYHEEPPIINCHTEDEIYNAIIKWSDRKKLQELGERAEKWVRKYHDVHTADFSEFIFRVCQTAGLEWPRPDLSKAEV